jgi:separase
VYCEALALSDRFDFEDKGLPSFQRIQTRVKRLEKAAMASHVFALIQYSIVSLPSMSRLPLDFLSHVKDEVPTAFVGLLQSLRLWNRAVDTLTRLSPHPPLPSASADDANPFQMTSLKEALPTETSNTPAEEQPPPKKTFPRRPSMDGLEWRVSEGLLVTLFSLSQAYLNRGSAREAEYFAQQAQDLAESLNTPTMVSRALAKKGEIQLYQGHLEVSYESLMKASALLQNMPGIEGVDVRRLHGVYHERMARAVNASELYEETIEMIEELDQAFKNFDGLALRCVFCLYGPLCGTQIYNSRKSIGASPVAKPAKEVILPEKLAAVLRQRSVYLRLLNRINPC